MSEGYWEDVGGGLGRAKAIPGENTTDKGLHHTPGSCPRRQRLPPHTETKQYADVKARSPAFGALWTELEAPRRWAGGVVLTVLVAPGQELQIVNVVVVIARGAQNFKG